MITTGGDTLLSVQVAVRAYVVSAEGCTVNDPWLLLASAVWPVGSIVTVWAFALCHGIITSVNASTGSMGPWAETEGAATIAVV